MNEQRGGSIGIDPRAGVAPTKRPHSTRNLFSSKRMAMAIVTNCIIILWCTQTCDYYIIILILRFNDSHTLTYDNENEQHYECVQYYQSRCDTKNNEIVYRLTMNDSKNYFIHTSLLITYYRYLLSIINYFETINAVTHYYYVGS